LEITRKNLIDPKWTIFFPNSFENLLAIVTIRPYTNTKNVLQILRGKKYGIFFVGGRNISWYQFALKGLLKMTGTSETIDEV